MGLKTAIRKWLGIDRVESDIARLNELRITEAKLRKEIADAFQVVLNGSSAAIGQRYWEAYYPDEGARFEHAVRKYTAEQAHETAKMFVEQRIGQEAFIDEVVKRIRRKQLADSAN